MAKKLVGKMKLQVPAGQANPSPPVGPALGQRGINIMEFCKAFNADTQDIEPGLPIPVVITVLGDRTFDLAFKSPPAAVLIKKAVGLDKAANNPGHEVVAKITSDQIREIAETKMNDLNAASLEAAMQMIAGTARSMGIGVED